MLVLSGLDVEKRLDYPTLIARLRTAFTTDCAAPLRHQHRIPVAGGEDGVMLMKPAWREGGPIAVKIVNVFPSNVARGLPAVLGAVMVFDGATGDARAVIDGRTLTIRRTAAASALAADYLARTDARTLLVVGTGQLAPALAHAHACIRPLRRVLVWGRSPDKAKALAETLAAEGMNATPTDDLERSVREADIITCATLAKEALVKGAWLRPGAHLDLVGGFTPEMRETDDEAMRRARIFVDTREGALAEAGDIIQAMRNGAITVGDIKGELSELCVGNITGRGGDEEITVFKSVGTALEDLAAAELALERGDP